MHPGYAQSSRHSKNGSVYGQGIYAATNLSTAMPYARAGKVAGVGPELRALLLLEANNGVPYRCSSYKEAFPPPGYSCTSDMQGDKHCFFDAGRVIVRYVIVWMPDPHVVC